MPTRSEDLVKSLNSVVPTGRTGRTSRQSDQRGTAALEFALIGPVFLFLILGIFEFTLFMMTQTVLESGVREASRYGITGRELAGSSRSDQIRQIIVDHAGGLISADEIGLETLTYEEFGGIGQPEAFTDENANGVYDDGEPFQDANGNGQWDPDRGSPGVGNAGDIVVYKVSYEWAPVVALFRHIFPGGGVVDMEATVAVRNEPWPED